MTPVAEETALLRVSNLGKTFPGQVALAGVDMEIRAGEVHALVGENGSGKSTFIKILSGYHEPDPGGEVVLRDMNEGEAAIGFVHQDLALVDDLDATDNLALGRGFSTRFGRIDSKAEAERARDLLHRLGRDVPVDVPLGELLPVERSLVAMARALDGLGDSSVLVLDEPTAALPAPEVDRLFEAVRQVKGQGGGVLYVSHRLDEVFAIADRVTVFRDGRRVATVDVTELDHDGLVELMLGRALDTPEARREGESHARAGVALEIENLRGGTIQSFSATIREGEIVGVAGIVGSGREDLAAALVGVVPGSVGVVRVSGQKIGRRNPKSCFNAGLAMVPADRPRQGAIMEHSIADNITLPLLKPLMRGGRIARRREREDVRGWLDRVGLVPPEPDRILGTLSGGNQQKAVLARWLRAKPKALVLDEPTQGVDVGAKDAIHRLLRSAVAEGLGLLVCTAETEDLAALCDRILVMRNGQVAAELTRSEVTNNRIVKETLA